jgi:hypothetical protein
MPTYNEIYNIYDKQKHHSYPFKVFMDRKHEGVEDFLSDDDRGTTQFGKFLM